MTRQIKILYPDSKKNWSYLHLAKANDEEYFEFAENGAFSKENVPGIGVCYVHNSFDDGEEFSAQVGNPIDLGLSVLWADSNIGAASPSEYGKLFGYGDVSGEKWSEDEADYPSSVISGTQNDIATSQWGNGWRMPSVEEIKELAEKCKWSPAQMNGVKGNKVTGPNGNCIFIPYAGTRIGVDTFRAGQMGELWSGDLSKFGSPVNMMFFGYSATLNYGAKSSWGASVRAVKEK